MAKGQIFKNHTLKEYQEKYGNNFKLVKFSKGEVAAFNKRVENANLDPKVEKDYEDYLLADRKWWLIGDTYYEIPLDGKIIPHKEEAPVAAVKAPKAPVVAPVASKPVKVKTPHKFSMPKINIPKPHFSKPSFEWTKKINKKAALITCASVLVVAGGLVGGHYIYKSVQENKSIKDKIGGKDITLEEALTIASNFDDNVKFADSVNFDINLKRLEIKNATLTNYEQEEESKLPVEIPFNVSWNGIGYKNSITYQEMIILKGGDTKDSQLVPTKYLTSISTFLFHQTYSYVFEYFEEIVKDFTNVGTIEYGYKNNNGSLGMWITIPNLKTFYKEETQRKFNFTGDGKFEFGCRVDKNGFIEKLLLKVKGDKITYLSSPNYEEEGKDPKSGIGVTGSVDINIDATMTRDLAKEINIDYYVNGEGYKESGLPIKLRTMEIRDPLAPSKKIAPLEFDGRKYISNREYWAYFDVDEKYEFDQYNSGVIIDGVDYTKSSDPAYNKLAKIIYFESEHYGYVRINHSLMTNEHKFAVSLITK